MAMSDDNTIAVSNNGNGIVQVYNKMHGMWTQCQTIKQDEVRFFGVSIALYGHHMAVGTGVAGGWTDGEYVFTYNFDQKTNAWISNGKLSVPGGQTFVTLHNDMLVATVNDENQPELCGMVFKLSKTATPTNDNENNNNSNTSVKFVWKEFARLTTKGYPLNGHSNKAVRIEENMVSK